MKMRIALSLVAAGLLMAEAAFADPAPPPPPEDNGIGTSPSYDLMCLATPPDPCGIWVDVDDVTADARARAGEAPDVVVFTAGHTSCSDAIAAAETLWPGAAVVFEVEQSWRAKVADYRPPAVAPAMMEWRAPAPPIRKPMRAAFPLLAVLAIVVPLVQTVIGKIFAAQVKDANRRTEIAGYVDTAFHLVEQLGPQLGLTGHEKYLRFIQLVIDGLKAAGSPELSGKEMAELQQKAAVKAMLAKTRAILPNQRLPLPPPLRG
jgi:hypothetical protein